MTFRPTIISCVPLFLEYKNAVPFPGVGWLDRIATPETEFIHNGVTYSSVYAAFLNNEPLLQPCRNLNAYLNSMFLPTVFSARFTQELAPYVSESLEWSHYMLCYFRNLLAGIIVYYGTASVFHYFCYIHPMSEEIFAKRTRPTLATILDQVAMAQTSMIFYVMLPVIDEFLIEKGFTASYNTVQEIGGWAWYAFYFVLYIAMVEIGIYWVHRTLHTNKWLYKHIHMPHHKYNKPETLTPWASIAFHPLDGMLQASPYVIAGLVCPCHYLTHLILLFFTAVWATYIHDAMDWNIDPVMGSKYHTMHHTHYIYNYGQIFTFCDAFWGTLRIPPTPTGVSIRKTE